MIYAHKNSQFYGVVHSFLECNDSIILRLRPVARSLIFQNGDEAIQPSQDVLRNQTVRRQIRRT